ncbi:MAG: ABC transporter substrate-binding protein, partial [Chloroflexota bacterium]
AGISSALLFVLACGAQAPAGLGGQSAPAQPLKIGAIFSTTGALAGLGQEELWGAQVFVEEFNGKGGLNGRKIELIHINDESKAEQGLSAAKRLIQQDKVLAIVGPASVVIATSISPVLDENKVPAVTAIGDKGPITPYTFASAPVIGINDTTIKLAKEKGLTKVGLICQAGPNCEGFKKTIIPDVERELQLITVEQIQPADTDATPILAKMRSMGVQTVYSPITGQQAAIIARNFKQINYPGIFATTSQNANDTFIGLVGDAADIVNINGPKIYIYRDLPDSDPDKARLTAFAKAYAAKSGGKEPTQSAGLGYDVLLSLTEAIKVAGDNQEKIRETLENQKGLKALTGTINRSASEHNGMGADWVPMGIDAAAKRFTLKK